MISLTKYSSYYIFVVASVILLCPTEGLGKHETFNSTTSRPANISSSSATTARPIRTTRSTTTTTTRRSTTSKPTTTTSPNKGRDTHSDDNLTKDIAKYRPVLTGGRLHRIRLYDQMKCFPKVLCTLTKTGAFAALGTVSLNELADGYLKLLSAFPGGPPNPDLGSDDMMSHSFKQDIENPHFPSSYAYAFRGSEDEDDDDDGERKKAQDESEELLLTDPLLAQKERLQMAKLMEELKAEEEVDVYKRKKQGSESQSWTKSAMTLPFKLGGAFLTQILVPYLAGSDSSRRRKRNLLFRGRKALLDEIDRSQDPITAAMIRWSKLNAPQECGGLYPSCPFEAWEVVSMIKLIKDGQNQNRQQS